MPIRYRYSGENWTVLDADTFTSEKREGQCIGVGYRISFTAAMRRAHYTCDYSPSYPYFGGCTKQFYYTAIEDVSFQLINSISSLYRIKKLPTLIKNPSDLPCLPDRASGNCQPPQFEGYPLIQMEIENAAGQIQTINFDSRIFNSESGSYWSHYHKPNGISNLVITPRTTEPASCRAGCVFKAFKNGVQVYTETRSTCPEVEVVINQCPPNTCEVDCGTYVCCYGSDGISVFNYNK